MAKHGRSWLFHSLLSWREIVAWNRTGELGGRDFQGGKSRRQLLPSAAAGEFSLADFVDEFLFFGVLPEAKFFGAALTQ